MKRRPKYQRREQLLKELAQMVLAGQERLDDVAGLICELIETQHPGDSLVSHHCEHHEAMAAQMAERRREFRERWNLPEA